MNDPGCTLNASLPVAAGACAALTEVARTDIQYVADLAAAALREASIRPEVTELHFGEQRQGSKPPHRLVKLLGHDVANFDALHKADPQQLAKFIHSEHPQTIRAAILGAAKGASEIGDRAEAIRTAIAALQPGDALLIAGKGHETGQIVGNSTLPFSDHDAVASALAPRVA